MIKFVLSFVVKTLKSQEYQSLKEFFSKKIDFLNHNQNGIRLMNKWNKYTRVLLKIREQHKYFKTLVALIEQVSIQ